MALEEWKFDQEEITPVAFDYDLGYAWEYRVGRGEQGVLLVEPYKSEMSPR